MKVLYWRIVAVAALLAGALGGCGGPTAEELQQQVDEASKKQYELKTEYTQIQSELVGCEDSRRVFGITSSAEIDRLKKLNAQLKTQLGQ